MSERAAETSSARTPRLTLERIIAHPPERVFRAWTDQAELRQWMGPGEIKARDAEMSARVGGAYVFPMLHPDGKVSTVRGVVKELIANRKLRFTWIWDQDDGSRGRQTEVTVDFAPHGKDATRLVLQHVGFADATARDHHAEGWKGCFDSLEAYLAG